MSIIHVQDLCKEYQYYEKALGLKGSVENLFHRKKITKKAVNGVSFDVEKGEVVGLLGPNGSGKTTTLKMLSGILYPSSGAVSVNGFVPWERKKSFKMCFSLVSGQKSQLWPDLPAIETFVLNKEIYEVDDISFNKFLGEAVELLDVQKILNVQVRRLSLGERMKMELIASLLHQPQIMFLDEPTIGLDLISQINIRNFLKEYNSKHGTTIIITSHYLKDIEDLCRRAVVINNGSTVYDGSLDRISGIADERKIIRLKTDKGLDMGFLSGLGEVKKDREGEIAILVSSNDVNEKITRIIAAYPRIELSIDTNSLEEGVRILYENN